MDVWEKLLMMALGMLVKPYVLFWFLSLHVFVVPRLPLLPFKKGKTEN